MVPRATARRAFALFASLATVGASPGPQTASSPPPAPSSASPSAAGSPAPSPSPSFASVAALFAGSWRCDGYASQDSGTITAAAQPDSSLVLSEALDSGKTETDVLTYDRRGAFWQLTTRPGVAPLAATQTQDAAWIFSGTEGGLKHGRAVRIVLTPLGSVAFRKEHQALVREAWIDDAEAVCKRISAPSPDPSASRLPAPSGARGELARNNDRAYRLPGGTWACETIEGNSAPHTYRLARDGSILLHTALVFGARTFAIDERYRFDRKRNEWIATTYGESYVSTAPPWLGDKWTFDGVAEIGGRRVRTRMIYTDLEERAFRRDFRQLRRGAWATIASETCKRD